MSRAVRGAWAGWSLVELVVVIVAISLLALILLDRLVFYQEIAEKVAMEQTVQSMRSGLQMNIAALLLAGKYDEIERLAERNPVSFLEQPPAGYVGEVTDARLAESLAGRIWYFDVARREIVYVLVREQHFRPGPDLQKRARFRLVVRLSGAGGGRGLDAATLVNANGFSWKVR